jgi:hypothetical protein
MTIYDFSVITNTGFPYFHLDLQSPPEGTKLYLRFFDFSRFNEQRKFELDSTKSFELNAGLVSALYEFARNMDKKIEILEFSSKQSRNNVNEDLEYKGDVLITIQTEPYLLHESVQEKIKFIYNNLIKYKIPLDTALELLQNEEDMIINMLNDTEARSRIKINENHIEELAISYLDEMKNFGLIGICICSFDLSPIKFISNNFSFNDLNVILRNIGVFPNINPMEWIYRQSNLADESLWVYIINSGVGPNVDGLMEQYFYLLIAEPQSFLGEFPGKLTLKFNQIIG